MENNVFVISGYRGEGRRGASSAALERADPSWVNSNFWSCLLKNSFVAKIYMYMGSFISDLNTENTEGGKLK